MQYHILNMAISQKRRALVIDLKWQQRLMKCNFLPFKHVGTHAHVPK